MIIKLCAPGMQAVYQCDNYHSEYVKGGLRLTLRLREQTVLDLVLHTDITPYERFYVMSDEGSTIDRVDIPRPDDPS